MITYTKTEIDMVKTTVQWISRMVSKYCPEPLDVEAGRFWDWGQALARELHGLAGMNNSPPEPPEKAYWIMSAWERGEFPRWMRVGVRVDESKQT